MKQGDLLVKFDLEKITGCSLEKEMSTNEGDSKEFLGEFASENVTLITKVLPLGGVVYAIATDFGAVIDESTLSPSSFEVEVFEASEEKIYHTQ